MKKIRDGEQKNAAPVCERQIWEEGMWINGSSGEWTAEGKSRCNGTKKQVKKKKDL